MYSQRMKEPMELVYKNNIRVPDSAQSDFNFVQVYKSSLCNPSYYPMYHLATVLLTWTLWMCVAEIALCPDNQVMRRQERYHSKPDCFRLHSYAIPYFNHCLRNKMRKYRWIAIQNEPDWQDKCYSGVRPNGVQGHHLPWVRSPLNYIERKYYELDPHGTSCSHINQERIYHDIGYKVQERWLEEGEKMPWFQTGPHPWWQFEGASEEGAEEEEE